MAQTLMDPDARLLAPAPRTPAAPSRGPVPVTLLTGFLGAGKTTLLNRILTGSHGLRVGVLVNDFGAVNIDAALVSSVEENTVSLANGCVCCEIRDDLVASVEGLLDRPEAVDYVILEASGIADPAGIVMTFLDARYAGLLHIDSVICLVDADGVFRHGDDDRLTALKLRQIAFADLVVLNKTDLVADVHVEVIRDWIDLHIKRIRIIEAVRGDVALDVLLGAGRFDPAGIPALPGGAPERAGPPLERWSHRTRDRFSRAALQRMVSRELPASVYRCKGIIYITDSEQPHSLQVVGRRCDLTPVELDRPASEQTSAVVAIGSRIDPAELHRLFQMCVVTAVAPPVAHPGPH
ncbi:MAG: CobW family GTP-binding protein [Actinomycetota bacterium]|nr:CobW family GTP-binding protein [Actinomycetota bacterium]